MIQIEDYIVRPYAESGMTFEALAEAVGELSGLLPEGPLAEQGVDVRTYTEKIVAFGYVDLVLAPDRRIVGLNAYYANDCEKRVAFSSVLVLRPEVVAKAIILIRRALRNAKAQGMREFRLKVAQSNRRAIRLYERFGFTVCGETGGKFEMSKDLA